MRLRVLWFSPLLFWGCFGFACRAEALSPVYAAAFTRELRAVIALKPGYVWGGATSERVGLDCSGYLFLAAKRAGLPVKRTTSARMARGESGWVGRRISRDAADAADLCFWTFDKSRPHGHVGAFLGKGGPVTHASSKRGVVAQSLTGTLDRAFSMARRLTLGDL